eukprot:COSAG06_NODE_34680_length_471_cov_0.669355_1_plen_57_part_01
MTSWCVKFLHMRSTRHHPLSLDTVGHKGAIIRGVRVAITRQIMTTETVYAYMIVVGA